MNGIKRNDYWRTEEGLLILSAWRRDGMTKSQIADKIGISLSTIERWQRKDADFAAAMDNKADKVDIMVENAILKKALGFSVTEVKTVCKPGGAEEVTTVEKVIPPDISAASVWLKNRRPDKWRDKPPEDKTKLFKRLDEIIGGIDAEADR